MAENIRVICRIRPLNSIEIGKNSQFALTFPGPMTVGSGGKNFTFDGVIQPKSTQKEAYGIIGRPVVDNVLGGYNGTIFAYGQTSSGKTHTMTGNINDENHKGLVPRIIEDIFDHIEKMDENLSFLIKISYMEIYLEKIKDLFDPSKDNLPVGEDANRVPFVKGATERYVASAEEVFDSLEEGKNNRKVASTNMNADSSRSHSIFTIQVTQENSITKKQLHGKLYLVDLAGSEKVSKTGAEGTVLDEAKNINKSLSALGNVINALVEGVGHIPYRDSKLTRILQESLGGNAKTTMVICISPASFNETETRSTLIFGQRAKTIKNNVICNMELSADEWKAQYQKLTIKYNNLIGVCKKLEAELKKWRAGESVGKADWYAESNYNKLLVIENAAAPTEAAVSVAQPVAGPSPIAAPAASTTSKPTPRPSGGKVDDEQLRGLYQEMDAKDEEIAKLSQANSKLKQEIESIRDDLKKLRQERDGTSVNTNKLQSEMDSKKKEVKEVLQALEELALNFDQKSTELENKKKDLDKAQESLQKSQLESKNKSAEAASLKEGLSRQKQQFIDSLFGMLDDLTDIGTTMSETIGRPNNKKGDNLENQVSVVKLYISKIKAETKNFVSKARVGVVGKESEPLKKIDLLEKEKEIIKRNFEERLSLLVTEKRKLETESNQMKREISRLKADEKVAIAVKDIKDNKKDVYDKLHNSVKSSIDKYVSDVTEQRNLVQEKVKEVNEIKDKLEMALAEIDLMKKCGFGFDAEKQMDKREQARSELKGLEDNVVRELQTLHNLRKMFVGDLKTRIKKASQKQSVQQMLEDDEDEFAGSEKLTPQQKEKINFLESNLENLTKVHKQLVRDNADLRCELPKMEKRLKATMERVKQLEAALKEAKESAIRERKRLQNEVDRIKEVARQKGTIVRPAIARPIKAGGGKNK